MIIRLRNRLRGRARILWGQVKCLFEIQSSERPAKKSSILTQGYEVSSHSSQSVILDRAPVGKSVIYVGRHTGSAALDRCPLSHPLCMRSAYRHPARSGAENRISPIAVTAAAATIREFAAVEPDLAALPEISQISVVPVDNRPHVSVWRQFYRSLTNAPRLIVFVGDLDATPALPSALLAHSVDPHMLIVETDTITRSLGLDLPISTQWRSLVEFTTDNLNHNERSDLVAALLNTMQPARAVAWGSDATWTTLVRHGRALARATRFEVVHVNTPSRPTAELIDHMGACRAFIATVYTDLATVNSPQLPIDDNPSLKDLSCWSPA